MTSYVYHHIMLADYQAFLDAATDGHDRVARAVTVPHLFTQDERLELRIAMTARGMAADGGCLTSQDRGAWTQMKLGVILISESIKYRTGKYAVEITRRPDAEETWTLRYDYKLMESGAGRDSLWAELDKRATTRAK
jgi:hypothetical protein